MNLLTPTEDFAQRTLGGLHGALARLFYIASLKDEEGCYRHWGLAQTYGEDVFNAVAGAAHVEALLLVLRTPLPQLLAEVHSWDEALLAGTSHRVTELLVRKNSLAPENLPPVTRQHINSVLLGLRALASDESLQHSSRSAA